MRLDIRDIAAWIEGREIERRAAPISRTFSLHVPGKSRNSRAAGEENHARIAAAVKHSNT